jgi:oxygen-independent coproporphyrinogen-3 oxidase
VKYYVSLADKYIDALIKHAGQFKNKKIHSIYIGGGAPSVLSLEQIEKLLQALNDIFDISSIQEFTFELNPESTSKEKLNLLKNFGVNRLSIGLQSVEDKSLKFLGRIHDFKTFCDVYDIARKEGFNNINIDLIYGLPNQTIKDWEKILKRALLFDSEHLSLYPLSIEENTPFYLNGITINDNIQRDMYDKTVEILAKNDYVHYEISNWSKLGKESFHNSNYWRNFEYIGLGSGASGYFERIRYKNIENIERYIELQISANPSKQHRLLRRLRRLAMIVNTTFCHQPTETTVASTTLSSCDNNHSLGCHSGLDPESMFRTSLQNKCDNLSLLEVEHEYINDDLYKTEKIMLGLRLLNEGVDANCFYTPKHQTVLLECLRDKTLEQSNNTVKLSKESVFVFNQIVSKFM